MSNEATVTKKTYVEFFYPGTVVVESSVQEVRNRDEQPQLPNGAFAYRFYDQETAKINGRDFSTEPFNLSGMTYINGKVLSKNAIKKTVPDSRGILSDMSVADADYAVFTRGGVEQPLREGDSVIGADGQKIYPDEKKYPPAQKQR